MTQTRIRRMSNPVVVIGFILLIPSVVFTLIFGGCTILGSIGTGGAAVEAAEEVSTLHENAVRILTDIGYNTEEAETILTTESHLFGVTDTSKYSEAQLEAVTKALELESESTAIAAGAGLGTAAAGFGAFIGVVLTIGSFVSGLLGWILIMKKNVLKCGSCSAIVDAA